MYLSELEFYLDDFLTYCQSKGLSIKTVTSYEQSLKLFIAYLKSEHGVEKIKEVRTGHLRQYILYILQRGKYTVVNREASKIVYFPEQRTDYKKPVSNITISNYTRVLLLFYPVQRLMVQDVQIQTANVPSCIQAIMNKYNDGLKCPIYRIFSQKMTLTV